MNVFPRVSIILPVYNEAQKLPRMLDALLQQSYRDFEIILVDDGSVDQSWRVIQNYAENDQRIISLRGSHAGVSTARNLALDAARGEYVAFADADDWVDSEWLKTFIDNIGTYDCCEQSFTIVDVDKKCTIFGGKYELINTEQEKKRYLEQVQGYLVRTLLKNEIIRKNRIRFRRDVAFAEDRLFYLEYLLKASSLVRLPDCHYIYYPGLFKQKYSGKFFFFITPLVQLFHDAYGEDFKLNDEDFYIFRGMLLNKVLYGETILPFELNTYKRLEKDREIHNLKALLSETLLLKAMDGSVIARWAFLFYHGCWKLIHAEK